MKRLIVLLLVLVFVFSGCGETAPEQPAEDAASVAVKRMAELTAEDIKYITSTFHNVDKTELAEAMSAAAASVVDVSEIDDTAYLETFYYLDVYLSGGPVSYGSNDERFYLEAGLEETLVHVFYNDGKGGRESFFVSDAALRELLCENFRTGGVIDAAEYAKYSDIIEERAQERVDSSQGTAVSAYTGYEITEFEKVDSFEADGGTYDVYNWGVAFVPEDPYTVGWVGGMYLDADGRVCALEQHIYFAVKTAADGTQEHRFLFWDLYLGTDEETGRKNARESIERAFAEE